MVRVFKHDDGSATRGETGDLDGVLNCFGARVKQCGGLCVGTGRKCGEFFTDFDIALVRRDHETRVGKVRNLLADRFY